MSDKLPAGFTLDALPAGFTLDPTETAVGLLGMGPKTPDTRTAYQKAAQATPEAVGEQGGPLAKLLARFIIPQNEGELGMLLGTAGAQGLVTKAGLTGGKAALTRILGGAAGGEVGGEMGGQPPGMGGAVGAATGAVGEVAAPAVGWLRRSVTGMPARINAKRSGQIGEVIEQRVPALRGARNPDELATMARDFNAGKGPLLDWYGQATADLERSLAGRPLHIPELGGDVSIRQVMDELKQAGHYGYAGQKSNPNLRTIVGEEPRADYATIMQRTQDELNRLDPTGALATQFEQNRKTAAAGFTFLNMLRGPSSFRRFAGKTEGGGAQLNIRWLQEYVDQNQNEIRRKIGDEAFGKLRQVLWPDAKFTTGRDIAGIGSGTAEDTTMDLLRGSGGSPRLATAAARIPFPGIGAQYAGRAPFSPSARTRTLADILAGRAGATVVNPGGRTR